LIRRNNKMENKLEGQLYKLNREIESMENDCIVDKSDTAFNKYQELVKKRNNLMENYK
tara:strand:- start:4805 stop:4978 length:174 start_codon:yes stop_codon:yes gene_type:complete